MQKILFVYIMLFGLSFSMAQSVHQAHTNYFSNRTTSSIHETNRFTLNKQVTASKLNKVVFGFLPDWEYVNGAHNYIRYDLLTHLAVFPFQADASGNLKDPLGWPWNDVINSASANSVRLIATITNFNEDDIHAFLIDAVKRSNLFVNIKTKLQSGGFNGVNIDFENVKDIDKPAAIGNFFSELRKYLISINAGYEISFASPSVNFGNWNFSSIAQSCDYLFVMCYDFYGAWSTTTGPSSPFQFVSNSFTTSANYGSLVLSSPQKLILGVPYYGNYWKTKTKEPYITVDTTKAKKEFVQTLRYKEIFPAYLAKEIMWDDLSKTRWLRWYDISWNQIWYDDDSSLAVKFNFAIQKKLGGIGIWALGYDNGRQELWKLIEKKFTGPVEVKKEEATIPTSSQLFQNYPNPFNPVTIISFQISEICHVTLKVYDLLGREVAILIDEEKHPGFYNSQFLPKASILDQFPSGIYFYTIRAGNYSASKKMLLIK